MITRRELFTPVATRTFAALAAAVPGRASAGAPDGGRRRFPNVSLLTQDNQSVRFYDDLVKGKNTCRGWIVRNVVRSSAIASHTGCGGRPARTSGARWWASRCGGGARSRRADWSRRRQSRRSLVRRNHHCGHASHRRPATSADRIAGGRADPAGALRAGARTLPERRRDRPSRIGCVPRRSRRFADEATVVASGRYHAAIDARAGAQRGPSCNDSARDGGRRRGIGFNRDQDRVDARPTARCLARSRS